MASGFSSAAPSQASLHTALAATDSSALTEPNPIPASEENQLELETPIANNANAVESDSPQFLDCQCSGVTGDSPEFENADWGGDETQ